jgi:hypothetical protein
MKVIGISGKKKSGKDTVANILLMMNDGLNLKYSFGTEVKKEIATACNCTVDFIEANKDLFRPMLQWWGTEYRRQLFGHDYWIKKMRQALEQFQENNIKLVVIPDVRFENELRFLRIEWGAPIYRIERVNGECNDMHPSEIALDGESDFDFVLYNNGTVSELVNEVKRNIYI